VSRYPLLLTDECANCGRCCATIGLPPFEAANPSFGPQRVITRHMSFRQIDDATFDTELFLTMPAELQLAHAEQLLALDTSPSGNPCAWYDTEARRCKHYEWRPATCRRFDAGATRCVQLCTDDTVQLVWQFEAEPDRWRNPRG